MQIKQGDRFTIEPGTEIHSTYQPLRRIAKRRFTVTVHHTLSFNEHLEIVWAGSGGYWCWVKLDGIGAAPAGQRAGTTAAG
jgi:hypothetical protein